MMKTVICCYYLENTGDYPKRDVFLKGRRGHDLVHLLNQITCDCFSDAYLANIPAAKADITFLRNDPKLSTILQILSDFGQSARYYNLNVVLNEKDPGPSPDQEWQKFELEVLKEDSTYLDRIGDPSQRDSIHRQINMTLTIQCEKLARALARLLTIGGLGSQAKQISPHTHHFLFLMDDQLGKTNYENVYI